LSFSNPARFDFLLPLFAKGQNKDTVALYLFNPPMNAQHAKKS